jgi:hypothetical protein
MPGEAAHDEIKDVVGKLNWASPHIVEDHRYGK